MNPYLPVSGVTCPYTAIRFLRTFTTKGPFYPVMGPFYPRPPVGGGVPGGLVLIYKEGDASLSLRVQRALSPRLMMMTMMTK